MFYSLMCASDFLDDDIIISYGDIIYFLDILKSLINHSNKDCRGSRYRLEKITGLKDMEN